MRLITLLTLSISLSCTAYGQSSAIDPPQAALDHLAKTYPGASLKEWERDGTTFTIEFKQNHVSWRAYYSSKGAWLRTHSSGSGWTSNTLPEPVKAKLKARKLFKKISSITRLATPAHAELYYLTISGAEVKDAVLVFTPDGELVDTGEKE